MGGSFNANLLIGVDVGTTGVKAALFSADGAVLSAFAARHPTRRPAPGRAEQEPQAWLDLTLEALSQLSGHLPPRSAVAVGLTSQVNTHVFCDAALNPLMPAVTWQDARAAQEAAALDARVAMEDKRHWWGAPLPIDASHVLARMAHVKARHPDIWARTAHVLAPKDWVIAKLTGVISTDPMTAFGVVDQSLSVIRSLVSLVDGAAERLPPIAAFAASAGRVRPGLPCAGTPMVTGCMDAWAGLLGAGVTGEGDAVHLSGTSDIVGIVSSARNPTPGVIAFPRCEGITLHAGPTQSGGASLDWAARLFNRSPDELCALAAETAVAPDSPLFLPHLDGERAPIWDAGARGAFMGLQAASGPGDAALAVMEGTAHAARWLLETLQHSAGLRPELIAHAGGGARADVWCQLRADVLGVPLHRLKMLDAGVAGAALLAGVGEGVFASIADAAQRFVQTDRVFSPDSAKASLFAERHARYRSLYDALKPLR